MPYCPDCDTRRASPCRPTNCHAYQHNLAHDLQAAEEAHAAIQAALHDLETE